MSIEQKVEEAKKELKQEKKRGAEGKYRKLTWVERFGLFPVLWIFIWGVIAGLAWTFAILEAPAMLESKTITIINEASAKTVDSVDNSEEEKIDRVAELAEEIWLRESTKGKNNYSKCEEIGKINGIGYGIPGNGKYQCFDSHEDEMAVLTGWIIDKQSKGLSEKELLCLYSGSNYNICK